MNWNRFLTIFNSLIIVVLVILFGFTVNPIYALSIPLFYNGALSYATEWNNES